MKGRALPFIPLKPWQCEYLKHLYPHAFCGGSYPSVEKFFQEANSLVHETDWESEEAKAWERVWEKAK